MIQQALKEWEIDLEKSFLIGDKPSDLEAAKACHLKGFLFEGGNLLQFVQSLPLLT